MTKPAAKKGDEVTATDTHVVIVAGQPPAPVKVPFKGPLGAKLSPNVLIEHQPAATVGSVATNTPTHAPPPGGSFQKPPSNEGRVVSASGTVLINHKGAARHGDDVETCNDPTDQPVGTVVAASTVRIAD